MLLKQANNTPIYDYFTDIINFVWDIANKVQTQCERVGKPYLEYKDPTYKELLKIEKFFNDPHITKIQFGKKYKDKNLNKMDYDLLKSYKNELEKEAKQIQKEKEAILEMLENLEKEEQMGGKE